MNTTSKLSVLLLSAAAMGFLSVSNASPLANTAGVMTLAQVGGGGEHTIAPKSKADIKPQELKVEKKREQ